MVNYAFVALSLITLLASSSIATAQSRAPSETKSASENRALIESLVSKIAPPNIEDIHVVVVPAEFDAAEQKRTWAAVHELIKQAQKAWPELVHHLDDKRYCVTITDLFGIDRNWTVGDVCREIIARNLAQAYNSALEPESLNLYRTIRTPTFARDAKSLQEWCVRRADKKLFELQIEACKWATAELASDDNIARFPADQRKELAKVIEDVATSLAERKKAVAYTRFGAEEFDLYQDLSDTDPFACG